MYKFTDEEVKLVAPIAQLVFDSWRVGELASEGHDKMSDLKISRCLELRFGKDLSDSRIQECREGFDLFPRPEDRIPGYLLTHHHVAAVKGRVVLGLRYVHDLNKDQKETLRNWVRDLLLGLVPESSVALVQEAGRVRVEQSKADAAAKAGAGAAPVADKGGASADVDDDARQVVGAPVPPASDTSSAITPPSNPIEAPVAAPAIPKVIPEPVRHLSDAFFKFGEVFSAATPEEQHKVALGMLELALGSLSAEEIEECLAASRC